jgi:PAS domain S-box-containing protein
MTDQGGQLNRLGWALDKMAKSLEERQLQTFKAQQELEKSESLLRETQRLARTGGWELDLEAGKVYWSEEVYRIRELSPESEPDLELSWSLYPPQERRIIRRMVERARTTGEPWDLELKTETASGRPIWIRTIGKALVKEGRIVKLYGACQDITDWKEAEETRERLKNQLRRAQKLEALGTLAGGIAHDFNNILTSMMGYLQLAQTDTDQAHPAKKSLDQIQEAGARAQKLVGQILSFSRQARQRPAPTSLVPIIEEAIRIIRPSLGPGIEIKRSIEDSKGQVMADPTQIHQVLMNLLTNAAQAIEEEKGMVEIRLDRAELDRAELERTEEWSLNGLRPGAYQRLRVCDNGKGMDQRTMERIFDPFFTTKELEEGTGMGLAVVHGIVKGHRGGINVISRPGQGSTFEVFLPLSTEAGP